MMIAKAVKHFIVVQVPKNHLIHAQWSARASLSKLNNFEVVVLTSDG